ncbi:hypothetical protein BU25DRAFT_421615 [Macroventuria anomochaeta]|uniref:Uncharacterized protein n=1 Tax=Macroventuria anomochaeta TaxID=301207 RepID=A0ACB6S0E7_9PLEO|nr:uncharacterized protein BU25DRAFT_421615 [Macroventuria anomochaeta]KAF2627626.1 hypothetical protein BU25DRAFT_421615 [Macroventuria anomochaeta]
MRQRLVDSSEASAAIALDYYRSTVRYHNIDKVEKSASRFSGKRGREMEIHTRPDSADSQDAFALGVSLTEDQEIFIDADFVFDGIPEYDSDSAPPKRKRRRLDTSVEFDPLIIVGRQISTLSSHLATMSTSPYPPLIQEVSYRTITLHINPQPKQFNEVRAVNALSLKQQLLKKIIGKY